MSSRGPGQGKGRGGKLDVQTSGQAGASLPRNVSDAARDLVAAAVFPSPRLQAILDTAPAAQGRLNSLHRWRMARAVPMLTSWAKSQARFSTWEQAAGEWVQGHLPDWMDSHEELGAAVYAFLTGPPLVTMPIDWDLVRPYMSTRQMEEMARQRSETAPKFGRLEAPAPATSGRPVEPSRPPSWLPPSAKWGAPASPIRPWQPAPSGLPPLRPMPSSSSASVRPVPEDSRRNWNSGAGRGKGC